MKKTYQKPAIIHTEKIEARATTCSKADSGSCPGGPITSESAEWMGPRGPEIFARAQRHRLSPGPSCVFCKKEPSAGASGL